MAEQAIAQSPIELLQQAETYRRKAEQSFGEYALEAGRLLLQAKKRIPHGQWATTLAQTWGGSQRTAEVYMQARRRWDRMSPREREEALEQPFSRSLLVISQGPRVTPPLPPQTRPQTNGTNGTHVTTADSVEDFLASHERVAPDVQTSLETGRLIEQAVDYQGAVAEPEESDQEVEHEATPLDDILDQPRPARAPVEEDEDGVNQADLDREMQEEFDAAINEVARLEAVVRQLTRERDEARALAAQAQSAPASDGQKRGWDFVEDLSRYLKADESQRTPESLAKRASALPNDHGRQVIAYLALFFTSAQSHLNAIA